jgi:hypothetical protein
MASKVGSSLRALNGFRALLYGQVHSMDLSSSCTALGKGMYKVWRCQVREMYAPSAARTSGRTTSTSLAASVSPADAPAALASFIAIGEDVLHRLAGRGSPSSIVPTNSNSSASKGGATLAAITVTPSFRSAAG